MTETQKLPRDNSEAALEGRVCVLGGENYRFQPVLVPGWGRSKARLNTEDKGSDLVLLPSGGRPPPTVCTKNASCLPD